jgi:OOP family OmpA-OmpF porin
MKIKYLLVIGVCSLFSIANLSAEVLDREILVVSPKKIITQKVKTVMAKPISSPRISEIYFKTGSARITASQMNKLDKLIPGDGDVVVINGYSSSPGSEKYNIKLSKLRAESVRKYLLKKYPGIQVNLHYHGSGRPKYTNKTLRGRDGNQRVLVEIK